MDFSFLLIFLAVRPDASPLRLLPQHFRKNWRRQTNGR
jgi:hypothetical protein